MKWALWALCVSELVLVACTLANAIASEWAVLLLAANSVLLIGLFTRWHRKPSCCR